MGIGEKEKICLFLTDILNTFFFFFFFFQLLKLPPGSWENQCKFTCTEGLIKLCVRKYTKMKNSFLEDEGHKTSHKFLDGFEPINYECMSSDLTHGAGSNFGNW